MGLPASINETETDLERKERIRKAVNKRLKEIGEPHTIGQFLWHFDLDKNAAARDNLRRFK